MRMYLLGAVVLVLATADRSPAWWFKGHQTMSEAAVLGLPKDMPAFFREAARSLGSHSGEPDRWKNRMARNLRPAEEGNHYLDLEDLGGRDLPTSRAEFGDLLRKLGHTPERTGTLPYAIMENYDRLCCSFKDLRAAPDDPDVRARCLVYAGILAHYTCDLAMPLHTTRDYNGKNKDGEILQRGIHAKIDGFPEKFGLKKEEMGQGLQAQSLPNVWAGTLKMIRESHQHVERCYELDAAGAFDTPTAESRKFILERCRAGTAIHDELVVQCLAP